MMITPADIVVEEFGGVRKLAKIIKRSPASVSKWRRHETKDGQRGLLPSSITARILVAARKRGLKITAEDLILGREK
jgi:hypothetical protein